MLSFNFLFVVTYQFRSFAQYNQLSTCIYSRLSCHLCIRHCSDTVCSDCTVGLYIYHMDLNFKLISNYILDLICIFLLKFLTNFTIGARVAIFTHARIAAHVIVGACGAILTLCRI